MNHWDDIAIAILAGGQSTRMGSDKAALAIGGEPMLVLVARLALETGAPLGVVGRARPRDWPLDATADFRPDEASGVGPLAGLLGALAWNPRPRLLLLPCDVPLLEASALTWIAHAASACHAPHGLATMRNGQLEPLFSIYTHEVEEHARAYLASGRRSLHGLIERGDFEQRECPAEVAAQLFNCNTPEDFEKVRR